MFLRSFLRKIWSRERGSFKKSGHRLEQLESRLLLSAVSPLAGAAVGQGMLDLADWFDRLDDYNQLAADLGAVEVNIGAELDSGTRIRENLTTPILGYLEADNTPTTEELVAYLGDLNLPELSSLTDLSETEFHPNEIFIACDFQTTLALADIALNLGPEAENLGILLGDDALVDLDITCRFDFGFGFDLSAGLPLEDAFFITVDALSFQALLNEGNLNFDVNIGFLDARVEGGSLNLDAELEVAFTNPDNDADGRLTLGELTGTTFEGEGGLLTITQIASGVTGSLPVHVDLGDFIVAGEVGLDIAGVLFDGSDLSVDFAGPAEVIEQITAFTRLNSASLLAVLDQFGGWLAKLEELDGLAGKIPLVAEQGYAAFLGIVDAYTGWLDSLVDQVDKNKPNFSDTAEFIDLVAADLDTDHTVNLNYAGGPRVLTGDFDLAFDYSGSDALAVDLDLAGLGDFVTNATVNLDGSGRLRFTLGIDLSAFNAVLKAAGPLTSARLSGDAMFGISINGGLPIEVNIPAVMTLDNDENDYAALVGDINQVLADLDVLDLVVAGLDGGILTLTAVGGNQESVLSIDVDRFNPAFGDLHLGMEGPNLKAVVMGLQPLPADGRLDNDATFSLVVNGGAPVSVTVAAADTVGDTPNRNRQDLVDDINTALAATGVAVAADFAADGLLQLITTGLAENATLVVTAQAGNAAITELGLDGELANEPTDLIGLAFDTVLEHSFIENLQFDGHVYFSAENIDARARFGVVDILVENGKICMNSDFTVTTAQPLPDQFHPPVDAPSRILLVDLLGYQGDLNTVFPLTGETGVCVDNIRAGACFDLPVRVEQDLVPLPGDARIRFCIPDLSDPSTIGDAQAPGADPTDPSTWGDPLIPDGLRGLENISIDDIIGAITGPDGVIRIVDDIGATDAILSKPVPLVNRSIGEIIDYLPPFEAVFQDIASGDPLGSLQEFAVAIEARMTAAGLLPAGGGDAFSFDFSGGNLQFQLSFSASCVDILPLDMDLAELVAASGLENIPAELTDLIDLDASGNLHIDALATINLVFGFDLNNFDQPRDILADTFYLHQTTGFDFGIKAWAPDVDLDAAVGPLNMYIRDGSISLGVGNDPTGAALQRAGMAVSLDGTYGWAELGNMGFAAGDCSGEAHVRLPLFHPDAGSPLGGTTDDGNEDGVPDHVLAIDIADICNLTGVNLVVPAGFSTLFGNLDISLSLGSIASGLDRLLGLLEFAIGDIFGKNLPLVGENLREAADFIGDIRAAVNGLLDPTDTTVDLVRTGLFEALGPGGLGILMDNDSDQDVDSDDILAVIDADRVEFDLALGDNFLLTDSIAFDIGLPALGLDLDGTVLAAIDWSLALGFGVSTTEGFYLALDPGANEITANLDVRIPDFAAQGSFGFLQVTVRDEDADADDSNNDPAVPADWDVDGDGVYPSRLTAAFAIDLHDPGSIPDNRVTLSELGRLRDFSSLATATLDPAEADINLEIIADLAATPWFPSLRTDFHLVWDLAAGSAPELSFTDAGICTADFLGGFALSILEKVSDTLKPVRVIIDILDTRVPVLSDILDRKVTFLDLMEMLPSGYGTDSVVQYVKEAKLLFEIVDFLKVLAGDCGAGEYFSLGDMAIPGNAVDFNQAEGADIAGFLSSLNPESPVINDDTPEGMSSFMSMSGNSSIHFPIIEDKWSIVKLLLGQDVPLFLLDLPELNAGFSYNNLMPILPPVLFANFSGTIGIKVNFDFGYDTYGLRKFAENPVADNLLALAGGFYVADWDENGRERPEVTLYGDVSAGLSLTLLHAKGGIYAEVNFDLNDVEDEFGNSDGRMRGGEFLDQFDEGPT